MVSMTYMFTGHFIYGSKTPQFLVQSVCARVGKCVGVCVCVGELCMSVSVWTMHECVCVCVWGKCVGVCVCVCACELCMSVCGWTMHECVWVNFAWVCVSVCVCVCELCMSVCGWTMHECVCVCELCMSVCVCVCVCVNYAWVCVCGWTMHECVCVCSFAASSDTLYNLPILETNHITTNLFHLAQTMSLVWEIKWEIN